MGGASPNRIRGMVKAAGALASDICPLTTDHPYSFVQSHNRVPTNSSNQGVIALEPSWQHNKATNLIHLYTRRDNNGLG